jgi:Rieske Fe-S protein
MKNWLYIITILILFLGCTKTEDQNIPLYQVDITIYANNPSFNNISVPGTWTYVNGGSRGIIIYRVSNEEFKAYDRHCTYEPNNSCGLVSVDATNITGVDGDCCGSTFILTDGSVTKGPASLPLKQYQTSFDGSVLRIFN